MMLTEREDELTTLFNEDSRDNKQLYIAKDLKEQQRL